jgi:hypothetical protein
VRRLRAAAKLLAVTSLFTVDGDRVVPTEYSRGPWDPRSCHGGPIAALVVRAVERVEPDTDAWQIARATIELQRPVPVLEPLGVTARVERPGRMVSLVSVAVTTTASVEVARALVLRIRRAAVGIEGHEREEVFSPVGVGELSTSTWPLADTAFHKDSVELRFSAGTWADLGPVDLWGRLLVPLFEGETPSPLQRVAAISDFGNGVSSELDGETMLFINPDLTIHLSRPPVGEWVGLRSRSHYGDEGAGLSDSALYDEAGRLGRAVQSILLARR